LQYKAGHSYTEGANHTLLEKRKWKEKEKECRLNMGLELMTLRSRPELRSRVGG